MTPIAVVIPKDPWIMVRVNGVVVYDPRDGQSVAPAGKPKTGSGR